MNKLLRSFGYAYEGICYAIKNERNMRIHVAVAPIVLILGAIVSLSPVEWCIIVLVICSVMSLELINTAIESIVDHVSPDIAPLAKIAKDVAAGAVLLMAIASVIIGIIIFVPKLWHIFL